MGTDEFYKLTGVPINTQKDWRAKGGKQGPQSAVVGGRIKYRRSDVLAWINEQFDKPVKRDGNSVRGFSPLGGRSLNNVAH